MPFSYLLSFLYPIPSQLYILCSSISFTILYFYIDFYYHFYILYISFIPLYPLHFHIRCVFVFQFCVLHFSTSFPLLNNFYFILNVCILVILYPLFFSVLYISTLLNSISLFISFTFQYPFALQHLFHIYIPLVFRVLYTPISFCVYSCEWIIALQKIMFCNNSLIEQWLLISGKKKMRKLSRFWRRGWNGSGMG